MKRPRSKAGSNLKLPESVLGEIQNGQFNHSDNSNVYYQNKFKSRKEERKKKRQKIKQQNIKRNQPQKITPSPSEPKSKPKKPTENKKKSNKPTPVPFEENPISRVEFEEERYMQLLEKKLKIKNNNYKNSFSGDGLDFLLEGIQLGSKKIRGDLETPKDNHFTQPDQNTESSEEEDNLEIYDDESNSDQSDNDIDEESDEDDLDEEPSDIDDIADEQDQESDSEIDSSQSDKGPETQPDPKSDSLKPSASIISKYVPPHLRQPADENSKIKKLVQGLINRLAENNLESTLLEIDGFYRDYSRNSVSTSVSEIVLLSISNHSHLSDSLVIVSSGLVAGLYRIAGTEFAAHFIQSTVEKFNQYHLELNQQQSNADKADNKDDVVGKECNNLITLISELYNFNVIACNLIYDLIRVFIGSLNEHNVELLLKLLRSIGHQLRTDDPTAMKEIYLMAITEMKNHSTLAQKSRVKFMMETMSDLKNNKLKKQGASNSGDSILQRIKTFLKNLEKRFNRGSIEALRVSLDDIINVKTKGKWWLVGASWVGQQYDPNEKDNKSSQPKNEEKKNVDELSQLAKQQSMNTEIRKAIFTVLMSSNDFIDAYERIMKLNLTSVQQREIIRVLAHCCGNEKIYNPFYRLVSFKFCQYDHSFKITLQYCLWDFCRELGDNSVGGMGYRSESHHTNADKKVPLRKIHHMSKFYGELMAQGSLSMNAFKGLTLTRIQMIPNAKLFFILYFCHFLSHALSSDDNQQILINGVANLAALNPMVIQEISLFLNLHVLNSEVFGQMNPSEQKRISEGISLIKNAERSKLRKSIE